MCLRDAPVVLGWEVWREIADRHSLGVDRSRTRESDGWGSAFAAGEVCLRMRMCRQCVVCVMEDAMVIFPRRVRRVDVNDCVFEVRQMVQQLMPYRDRDCVAF